MIALALAGVLTLAQADGAPLLLPGEADLPLLRGARPAPVCAGLLPNEATPQRVACVTAPMRVVNDLTWAYQAQARAQGWVDDGGAASALWMRRPATADRCAQRLTIVAFWDWKARPEPRPNDPGYIGFYVEPIDCETLP